MVEILEHQVVELPVAADVVNGTDVRIVQRGNRACLVLEALPRFRISRERDGEHLDGDGAIEPGVVRAVDLAHTARTKRGYDFVRTEARARGERHLDEFYPRRGSLRMSSEAEVRIPHVTGCV
jgi:hypothetical protein